MVMDEIRSALQSGASREQLESAGYKRSSIYQAAKQLKKAGAGDRRQVAHRRAKVGVTPVIPAALPAPSSELSDMREQVALVKLGNELAVAKQQAERLKPETPRPPTEIDNARAMLGFFSDLKTSFPPPEPSSQTPAAGGSKLNSEQLLNLDIARMEMEERNLIREEERDKLQVERQTELVQEVGGYLTKGLGTLVSAFREIKATEPARVVRGPALNPKAPALEGESTGKFPAMIRSADGQVWTRPSSPDTDVVPSEDVMLKPADRPGGTWIASVDESGVIDSWVWAVDPPVESVRERLRRVGVKAAGQNSRQTWQRES